MQADRFDQLVADGMKCRQRAHRLLEHQADLAAADRPHLGTITCKLHQIDAAAIGAAEQNFARHDPAGALDDAQDGSRGDALAAAGLADDAERAARVEIERRSVDGAHHPFIGKEVRVQVTHRQDRISHKDPPRRAARRPGS